MELDHARYVILLELVNNDHLIVSIIIFCTLFIRLIYLGLIFRAIKVEKNTSSINSNTSVSVVICAKNEAENLSQYLPQILNQDYPNFEVILVDDFSEDDTLSVAQSFNHPRLKVIQTDPKFEKLKGKRGALLSGVTSAEGDILIFTDADCYPRSRFWIKEMVQSLQHKSIVIGAAPIQTKAKSWGLNRLVGAEQLFTHLLFISAAKIGYPYMATGRNVGYRKSFFLQHHQFETAKTVGGDDDLLINKWATPKNTAVCLSREAQMLSFGPTSWTNFWRQKQRHLEVGWLYKWHTVLYLGLFIGSFVLFYFSTLIMIYGNAHEKVLILQVVVWLCTWGLYYKPLRVLNQLKHFWWMPVNELCYTVYYVVMSITNPLKPKRAWK